MGNVGWSELLVIGIVALIIVGPKDLPVMFHTLGRFAAKVRSLGREFTRAMDDAVKESGVRDAANSVRDVTTPKALGLDKMQDAAKKFESWDPMKPKPKETPKPKASTPASTPLPEMGEATAELAARQKAEREARAESAREKATARAAAAGVPEIAPTKPAKKPTKAKAAKVEK